MQLYRVKSDRDARAFFHHLYSPLTSSPLTISPLTISPLTISTVRWLEMVGNAAVKIALALFMTGARILTATQRETVEVSHV